MEATLPEPNPAPVGPVDGRLVPRFPGAPTFSRLPEGDHTIALPMLRAVTALRGPVALVHFDAHLDTWDTYFDAPTTHGTVFRRAFEEGLLTEDHSVHIGIRGPIYGEQDLADDRRFGFRTIRTSDVDDLGIGGTIDAGLARGGDLPLYPSRH